MFRLPASFVSNLYTAWLPLLLEQFSESYGDAVSWAQSSKHSHQIE